MAPFNEFLDKEFQSFQPDVVYTDSVCFWGKLNGNIRIEGDRYG